MENASKALLMAGGILIALLILGALILMFTKVGEFNSQNDAQKKQSQIAAFNNQFEPYNGKNLTLMDLKSLYLIQINGNNDIKDAVTQVLNDRMNSHNNPDGSPPSQADINRKITMFFDDFKNLELDGEKRYKTFAKCKEMEFKNEGNRISNVIIE